MKKQILMIGMMTVFSLGLAGQSQALLGDIVGEILPDHDYDNEDPGTPVPEPSSALVFGAGLLTAAMVRRQRRSN